MRTLEKVMAIVAEALELEGVELDIDALLIMDSVLRIEVLTPLEEECGIQIPEDRAIEMKSIRSIAAIVDELLAQRP